jgi:hypothetical protein
MSDTVLFALIFGGLFVLRIIAATCVFLFLLPRDGRCPNCDEQTVRVASALLDRCLPWFRKSWCLRCGWDGILRRGDPSTEQTITREKVTHGH